MNWLGWVLVIYFAANAIGSVALIGKRRDPLTPGTAVVMLIWYAVMITLVVVWWPS